MERQLSLANGSPDVEEIPDIRSLSLAQLETLLAQHEAGSQEALRDAFASRDEAERLREAATRCDADAQASRARYEHAEYVIHELRKAIVEQNKNILKGLVEPGRIRAYGKRQHVSAILWFASLSLLELTDDASAQVPNQTCHGSEWHPRPTEPVRR